MSKLNEIFAYRSQRIKNRQKENQEYIYNQMLAQGIFQIIPQETGPSLFIVHRDANIQGGGRMREQICINPSDGIGSGTDNPMIASGKFLDWIREKTGWSPEVQEQWAKNLAATRQSLRTTRT